MDRLNANGQETRKLPVKVLQFGEGNFLRAFVDWMGDILNETTDFNGNEIEVLDYLPIEDKYDLINIALQKSRIEGKYNPLLLDMYFHLYLVYMYSNITFTEKQKESEEKLYDTLSSNHIIDRIIANIPEEEYNLLQEYIAEIISTKMEYNTSAASLINKFINDLPKNAEAALSIVDNFDPEKFEMVKEFAEAANGGRSLALK